MTVPDRIRALLRQHRDGLSIPEMVEHLGVRNQLIYQSIHRMKDAWIERWECGHIGRPRAVWRTVPPNCPPPPKGRVR
jgi:transposase